MVDFEEDFLQKIVDVQWGDGQWFGVRFVCINGAVHSWEMDFPGKAGGTPGYVAVNNGVVDSRAKPHPHTIVAADLAAGLKTNAGAGFTGLMYKTLNSGTGTDGITDVLVKMDGTHFPKAFDLNLVHSTPGGFATAQTEAIVYTVKKNTLKAGISILASFNPGPGYFDNPPVDAASRVTVGSALLENHTYGFRINPETLTVTQTSG